MEENDKSKNSENKVQEDAPVRISKEDKEMLARLLGIKLMDTSVLEELSEKTDYTDKDIKKLLDYTEYVKNFMEEEKKHPRESSAERITRQLAQERADYMKRWNAMTDEEKMKEAEDRNSIVKEMAERTGARVKNVKVKIKRKNNGK